MARRIPALFIFIALSAATPLMAQEFTQGVRPSGMGMAYTGVAEGANGLYFNPGGIASSMMYQVEGAYEFTPTGSVLNATIIDSKTNPDVAAGVGYSYYFGREDAEDLSGHDLRLGVALPVLPQRISVGVGGRYIIVHHETSEGTEKLVNGFTLDAGALFQASDMIEIGVAGRNLLNICGKNKPCTTIAPTTIAGGISLADKESFVLAIDGGVDLDSDPDKVHPFFQFGAEYFAGGVVPLRVGYQRLEFNSRNMITAGMGMRLKSAGLDAGFRIDASDSDYYFVNGSFSLFF